MVPGGSSVRAGAYLGPGVVVMPPAYVNVGAYVGEGSMIDSHALVGSCAQVGRRVHLSAGAMIGGVLEPVGALPVIVEDEALVGGNCGVYEGADGGPARRAGLGGDPYRLGDGLRRAAQDHVPADQGRPAAHPRRGGGGARLAPAPGSLSPTSTASPSTLP